MPTILGINFGREFFRGAWNPGKKQGRKNRGKKSPSKFAEKFAGNFPNIRRTKIKNSPHIRSAQPRAQHWRCLCRRRQSNILTYQALFRSIACWPSGNKIFSKNSTMPCSCPGMQANTEDMTSLAHLSSEDKVFTPTTGPKLSVIACMPTRQPTAPTRTLNRRKKESRQGAPGQRKTQRITTNTVELCSGGPFFTGPNFIHPHPPTPENSWRVAFQGRFFAFRTTFSHISRLFFLGFFYKKVRPF